ncbi:MAG: hypothetical protein MJZ26_08400 [Fibrobacter sp.]|nr:hypothetical protein [Fibrobacter sp.]
MKHLFGLLYAAFVMWPLCACADSGSSAEQNSIAVENSSSSEQSVQISSSSSAKIEMNKIKITIGSQEFTATLADNATAKAFAERLPLTVSMTELHGNEYYVYLDSGFKTTGYAPDTIKKGDIKVYGSDCLVFFYETFSNPGYSYSDIGTFENPDSLKDSLKAGAKKITIQSF